MLCLLPLLLILLALSLQNRGGGYLKLASQEPLCVTDFLWANSNVDGSYQRVGLVYIMLSMHNQWSGTSLDVHRGITSVSLHCKTGAAGQTQRAKTQICWLTLREKSIVRSLYQHLMPCHIMVDG